MRKNPLPLQAHDGLFQTGRPTKAEVSLLRGLMVSIGMFLATAAILTVHQVHVSRMIAAHLAAGGTDDPDALFGRWHMLIFPFVVLPMGLAFVGMLVCGIGWATKRFGRRRSTRQQAH